MKVSETSIKHTETEASATLMYSIKVALVSDLLVISNSKSHIFIINVLFDLFSFSRCKQPWLYQPYSLIQPWYLLVPMNNCRHV